MHDSIRAHSAAIHWFRKGLRLHDNPALIEACRSSSRIYPVFCIDPYFAKPDIIGVNRYSFLLESLHDLDMSLRDLGSRLFVVKGKPEEQLPLLVQRWSISLITFEKDTEPYAMRRDALVADRIASLGVVISSSSSHTLFDPESYIIRNGGVVPTSYGSFQKVFQSMGPPRAAIAAPNRSEISSISPEEDVDVSFDIPTLEQLGYASERKTSPFIGGETEALRRLQEKVADRPTWTAAFDKPNTSPNSLTPSTTVLSPYLKFGCLSATRFLETLTQTCKNHAGTKPPVSLTGQLLWREFFYMSSVGIPHFDRMEGNPRCKQIPWQRDQEKIAAWKEARTGYPFIDAIMTQLRQEGWIHHLARHAVACFLTRGDLWQHWEEGVRVFDLYLLDDDWALNNANWQWLSCSNFFYQYFRCYSPVAFGKKTDKSGEYIRKWLPILASFPDKYIYEPWKAPLSVQTECGCIIGRDYPGPIVIHELASKENMARMKLAYAGDKDDDNDDVEPVAEIQSKKKLKKS
eukprot:gene25809-34396_t